MFIPKTFILPVGSLIYFDLQHEGAGEYGRLGFCEVIDCDDQQLTLFILKSNDKMELKGWQLLTFDRDIFINPN